jgi:hypothetical protein
MYEELGDGFGRIAAAVLSQRLPGTVATLRNRLATPSQVRTNRTHTQVSQ